MCTSKELISDFFTSFCIFMLNHSLSDVSDIPKNSEEFITKLVSYSDAASAVKLAAAICSR